MKPQLKNIIGNGSPYGILFFTLSFLLGYYTTKLGLQKTLIISSIMGIAALLINGMMYNRFTKSLKLLEQITIELEGSETLLFHNPANFLVDDGLIPGKLFLTEQRLIFKSFVADDVTKAREYSWNRACLHPDKFYGTYRNPGGQFRLKVGKEMAIMFEVNHLKTWKDIFI